jgi:hypothetical protein
MRNLERALGGGLGRGNVGVVASPRGVGKTPFLVQLALDALLREQRVLHLSHEHTVEHVRSFYDELLQDLGRAGPPEALREIRADVERGRLIYSTLGLSRPSLLGASAEISAVANVVERVRRVREEAGFEPDLIVVDGLDLGQAGRGGVRALGDVAERSHAELWAAATIGEGPVGLSPDPLPAPLDRVAAEVRCVVLLEPVGSEAHVRLLKNHAGAELGELGLRFEPHTMRVLAADARSPSVRPVDPRLFHLISGGGQGAEAEFGRCAERWGLRETHYSFAGHVALDRSRGVVVLTDEELARGDFSLRYVSHKLGRDLGAIPSVRKVLQSICHQISDASEVFVVGAIQHDGTVRGGTGWGAELARAWKKPVHVFDQAERQWRRWTGLAWEPTPPPVITSETFAGIGTQRLDDEGKAAIVSLFERTFGPAEL